MSPDDLSDPRWASGYEKGWNDGRLDGRADLAPEVAEWKRLWKEHHRRAGDLEDEIDEAIRLMRALLTGPRQSDLDEAAAWVAKWDERSRRAKEAPHG